MQLYAFEKNESVFVDDAEKGASYTCTECGQEIRVRGGRYNIRHFYHVKPKRLCEYQRRSLTHIAIQRALVEEFPKGEISLETRIKKGGRIADALWKREKIVFEVQCSQISLMEVMRREDDYSALGYKIVWILSDRKFNKRFVSPAERELRKKATYYASHAFNAKGCFYDQFEIIHHSRRVKKLPPLPISIRYRYPIQKCDDKLPGILLARERHGGHFSHGDLYYRSLKHPAFRRLLLKIENEHLKKIKPSIQKMAKKEGREMFSFLLKKSFH
jgi:competence CoiA-like predicted nuclease